MPRDVHIPDGGEDLLGKINPEEYLAMLNSDDMVVEAKGGLVVLRHTNEQIPITFVFNEVYNDALTDFMLDNSLPPIYPDLFSRLYRASGLNFSRRIRETETKVMTRGAAYYQEVIDELRPLGLMDPKKLMQAYLSSLIPEMKEGIIKA